MYVRGLICAALLLMGGVAGCGPSTAVAEQSSNKSASASASVEGELTRIGMKFVGVWGVGRTEWWIEPSGRGGYISEGHNGRADEHGTFEAGPEAFRRIRGMLADLEGVDELPCEPSMTDQAVGALSWTRGGQERLLPLDDGCSDPAARAARDTVADVTTLIRGWALE